MTNKALKDFYNSLHKDLRVSNNKGCFAIKEKDGSAIRTIHLTFKNKDDAIIIRQIENQHTIEMLQGYSTNCSCDFIVLLNSSRGLEIYFCEIKSSYQKKYLDEAIKQIESSQLFLQYLLDCYSYYYKNDDFKNIDISKSKKYYIYPFSSMSQKRSTSASQNRLEFKAIVIDSYGTATIANAYNFFGV
ncbi:hypothetical protein LS70_004105 [Helicobacter sp. MIT 11-5569]|uniref:hypothetical protein n=1 Tax=Helicobacter sp. MIT 11-5569 TaxID=1548151 RepID=UPI00051F9BA3|nr:hypothetical protein [Helicobacter sp. MIT 11-5569]TLD83998.1 hypothetical protein LS70_004105 [Helicobacter sp. MIT 11-5569]